MKIEYRLFCLQNSPQDIDYVVKKSAINIDPEIMSGAPVFRGTRVTIKTLFDYLEHNKTVEDFLEDYDWVRREQVHSVMELAGRAVSNKEMLRSLNEDSV